VGTRRGSSREKLQRVGARPLWGLALLASASVATADQIDAVHATGNWLTPALTYDGTALHALRGGARTGTTYVGNLHLKLSASGEPIGWAGTSAYAELLTIHGGHPSHLVGDAQGVSNLEGPSGTQVEELWLQHNFKDSGASLLIGLYDLNSEFYRSQAAGLFVNSAFGVGPEFAQSGIEGPSIFPRTSAGLRLAFKPTADMVLRTAVLDGVPVVRPDGSHAAFRSGDGLLIVTELAMLARPTVGPDRQPGTRDRIGRFSSLAPYDDKLAIGAWHYTGRFADLADTDTAGKPPRRSKSSGAYLIGERRLPGGAGSPKRAAAFVQAGIADARTNRFGSYLGAGIVASGWGPMKDSDQFGVSVAHATNGRDYLRSRATGAATSAETTLEWTYLTQLSKSLTVQPDLQYVIHPGTDPSIRNAWVLQLRFEIAL
jgi:porin